jgi:FkbM family methyltransferase
MQNSSFIINLSRGIIKRITSIFRTDKRKADLNWFKEKFLKHISSGKIRTYKYKGKYIYYSNPKELLYSLKEIFINKIYKIELEHNPYIIDCGANIGLTSIYLKELYPSAKIIAFEPDPKNYELLIKNIESFNLNNVIPRKEAVWVENTKLKFSGEGTMGSKLEFNTHKNDVYDINAIRLRDIINTKISFLKLDIEGAEYEVIKDIAPYLNQVRNLFIEYHGKFDETDKLTEIFTILNENGFSFYIKEAADIYKSPFMANQTNIESPFNVQLNIFCFRYS